ncbi:MAG: methanol dehydrogenase, partial [Dehalococcoidia bacterium]
MKRILLSIVLCLVFAVLIVPLGTVLAAAQNFPELKGYVNDYAGVMTLQGKAQLEARLSQLEKDTTAQVFVATIKSLEGNEIQDYANRLFEAWKIGQKDKNNGVLLLVAPDDRKMWIEVGYGLEPIITDARAGRIRDDNIIPAFKEGDYEKGIIDGAAVIEDYIRKGTPPAPLEENPVKNIFGDWIVAFFILSIITVYMSGFMARSKSVWLGGIWGAIAGALIGLAVGGIAALIIGPIIFAALGLGT